MTAPAFTFLTAGRIDFGRGRAADAAVRVAGYGRKVCLVHGASKDRARWLLDGLEAEGCTVTAISCGKEPDLPLLRAALATARAAGSQVVVSLGGGAVLDLGKAVAALLGATTDPLDHLEVVGKGQPLVVPPAPFIAIPTTAGTGAEVTKNAVIGVPEHRRKVSLRDDRMLADLALVDPALTDGLPRAVTLASGLDAITQVIEPFLCTRANPMTDALCREAIPRGLRALAALMLAEDADARDDLALCSLFGGLALANAGLGAVHGLAGVIGGVAPGAPHGAVCGVLLPHVLKANGAPGSPAAARVAQVNDWIEAALGCGGIAGLADWSGQQGLPGLEAMGVDPGDFGAIANAAQSSSSMKPNPVPLDASALEAILSAAR